MRLKTKVVSEKESETEEDVGRLFLGTNVTSVDLSPGSNNEDDRILSDFILRPMSGEGSHLEGY